MAVAAIQTRDVRGTGGRARSTFSFSILAVNFGGRCTLPPNQRGAKWIGRPGRPFQVEGWDKLAHPVFVPLLPVPQRSPRAAMSAASRWSRRRVLTASRACHRSTRSMVSAALASGGHEGRHENRQAGLGRLGVAREAGSRRAGHWRPGTRATTTAGTPSARP